MADRKITKRKFFVTGICSLMGLHWRRSVQRDTIGELLFKRRLKRTFRETRNEAKE
jgi:hypothetical protein